MENPGFAYEDGGVAGVSPASPLPPGQYKFSAEELRVLKECNSESFVQRSAPLGTLLGLATYFGVQKGHLKPNARFGAYPKVSLAVIVGYFIGKISYQQACAEKLMALPNSYLGQLLRDRRDGRVGTPQSPKFPHKSTLGITSDDIYSDAGPGNALDLDTDRPQFSDDAYRSGDIGLLPPLQDDRLGQPSLSYDELRKRNRGEYSEARKDPYKVEPGQFPTVRRPPPASPPSTSTNKYGDAME
ncbi:OCIA domain-containing protein 1 isoform X2 [Aricia agestis]|uniref:OCIA domain-containing protein 1 isoform X2 n=1 Tax=Aricia agestis TaxID=91739 RepID=UPI001C207706|nr:OCIA domain-containing protein 1 isoform X2 [Aricia agestis]